MKNKTAKQQAKLAIQGALWGRMSDLIPEVDEIFESSSEKNKAEIKMHIQIYLVRIEKYIK